MESRTTCKKYDYAVVREKPRLPKEGGIRAPISSGITYTVYDAALIFLDPPIAATGMSSVPLKPLLVSATQNQEMELNSHCSILLLPGSRYPENHLKLQLLVH